VLDHNHKEIVNEASASPKGTGERTHCPPPFLQCPPPWLPVRTTQGACDMYRCSPALSQSFPMLIIRSCSRPRELLAYRQSHLTAAGHSQPDSPLLSPNRVACPRSSSKSFSVSASTVQPHVLSDSVISHCFRHPEGHWCLRNIC
jgi:hypothetical protein